VGTPLNDTQLLTGVFKPTTELVMKVIGDQLTVEAHNSVDAATLALTGTITPNDFGGAGADWYGTVSRGNSNVFSRFEISYPGVTTESCATAAEPGAVPQSGLPPSGSDSSGSGPSSSASGPVSSAPGNGSSASGPGSSAPFSRPAARSSSSCALESLPRGQRWALGGGLLLVSLLVTRRRQGTREHRG